MKGNNISGLTVAVLMMGTLAGCGKVAEVAYAAEQHETAGYHETIIARDYKGGCLVFEMTGHNTGDDELDMLVSDNLAMIIDSVSFC